MNIGILTYHRSINYGALLQAIATRVVLQKMGQTTFYIDYWPKYHQNIYRLFSWKRLLRGWNVFRKVRYVLYVLRTYRSKCRRKENFNVFISKYIEPYCKPMGTKCDVVIHGSDQIWRKQPGIKKYNPIYFGENGIVAKQISYAASMGELPQSEGDKEVVKELLANLDLISVREEPLKKFVECCGFSAKLVLDPTLLLSAEEWISVLGLESKLSIPEKYLLFYNLKEGSFDTEAVRKFAELMGLKLIVLYGKAEVMDSDNVKTTCDPRGFIQLIKNASFVLTSSFHGLAFSLLFNKPFFAAFSVGPDRASSLLDSLEIEGKLIAPMMKELPVYTPIDYSNVNKLMAELRMNSLNFLRSALA